MVVSQNLGSLKLKIEFSSEINFCVFDFDLTETINRALGLGETETQRAGYVSPAEFRLRTSFPRVSPLSSPCVVDHDNSVSLSINQSEIPCC